MKQKLGKNIILTIDYEIFYGKETGTVADCMINPTNELMNLCEEHKSSMTVFWDILHFYKLLELESENNQILEDRILIEDQIKDLVLRGHDVQLHLHPHWLDAEFKNSKWLFTYDRFSLHDLSEDDNENDINTIAGCIKISKDLMEKTIRKYSPSYNVDTFRAGGYLIEPFEKLSDAFKKNNILIDSSVCPNKSNMIGKFSYNFDNHPNLKEYNFEESLDKVVLKGIFKEIPIKTIYISRFRNLYFMILRKLKYRHVESYRKGSGTASTVTVNSSQKVREKVDKILKPMYHSFTSDSSFKEKYNYLLRKANNNSVQILHPKLLSSHMLSVMNENLKDKKVKFISIRSYLSK